MSEVKKADPTCTRRRPNRIQLAADITRHAREQHRETQRALLEFSEIKEKLEGVMETLAAVLQESGKGGFEETLHLIDDRSLEMSQSATELELEECHAELERRASAA